jgi:hypothetical protein
VASLEDIYETLDQDQVEDFHDEIDLLSSMITQQMVGEFRKQLLAMISDLKIDNSQFEYIDTEKVIQGIVKDIAESDPADTEDDIYDMLDVYGNAIRLFAYPKEEG